MIVMYVIGDLTIMCAMLLLAGTAHGSGNDCIYSLLTDYEGNVASWKAYLMTNEGRHFGLFDREIPMAT